MKKEKNDIDFVPYIESKAMKELGFDGKCFGFYYGSKNKFKRINKIKNSYDITKISETRSTLFVASPLYQQAFDWFRKTHELESYISPKLSYPDGFITGFEYYYSIIDSNGDYGDDGVYDFEEATIKRLRKLIEIVKERSNG